VDFEQCRGLWKGSLPSEPTFTMNIWCILIRGGLRSQCHKNNAL
jgi:hypothetical protein